MLVHVDDARNAYDIRNDALIFALMASRVVCIVQFKAMVFIFFFHVDDEHKYSSVQSNMPAFFISMTCSSFIQIHVLVTYNLSHSTFQTIRCI